MVRPHHHRTAHDKIFAKMSELGIRLIEGYRRSASIALRSEERVLQRSLANKQGKVHSGERSAEELDAVRDQLETARSIHGLAEELAVIALFRVVETSYGRVIRFVVGGDDIPDWVGFKRAREKWTRQTCGFRMDSTLHYDAIEDLRELNNTIKHRLAVGVALSIQSSEREDELRKSCTETYERVVVLVPEHIQDFAGRVLARGQQTIQP